MKRALVHIHLTLARPDGRDSHIEIGGKNVTPGMLDAAEDLLHALSTGERLLPKDLYDVCSRAFGTTRDDAKKRLAAAMYGAKAAPEPKLIGSGDGARTWAKRSSASPTSGMEDPSRLLTAPEPKKRKSP